MTVLAAIGATLLAGAAGATTPAATCRQDCAPRVEEQCRDLPGSAFRRCRRTLVRACRKTSPATACTTTREMTDALANRFVSFDGLGASAVGGLLKLCGDGRFATVDVESADPGSAGSWRVVIGNGGLALDLRAEQISADARFAIGRDDQDAIVVDGRPADTRDARG